MVTYKGFKVKAGVKWTVTADSITITCYPKKSSVPYKLSTHSWKNHCPTCGRDGTLTGFGQGRLSNGRSKFGVEGGVVCLKCDADFCGSTGRDTYPGSTRKLTPASSTKSSSSVAAIKCELTKAETLAKGKSALASNNKSKYKGTLIGPMLPKLKPDQYCQLDLEKYKGNRQSRYWIDSVKVDIDNQTMTAELLESMPKPSQEYKANDNIKDVNGDVGVKADSLFEKMAIITARGLGSVEKIYNWLRVGGTEGWRYTFYYNHWKNKGSAFTKDVLAMNECWNYRQANCTDFSWIFYIMCLGIGVKVNIIHGTARFGSKTYGHLWNTYNGKRYDCSSQNASHYNADRTVI